MQTTGHCENFDIVPLCTHRQTNGHTTMSQNFDIVPMCMSRCHHTACIFLWRINLLHPFGPVSIAYFVSCVSTLREEGRGPLRIREPRPFLFTWYGAQQNSEQGQVVLLHSQQVLSSIPMAGFVLKLSPCLL